MSKQKRKHNANNIAKSLPSDELFDFIMWVLLEGWKKYYTGETYYRVVCSAYQYKTQKQLYEMYLKRVNVITAVG